MHEAFTSVLEEGLEPRFARHLLNAEAFREGIMGLGLKPLAHPDVASPTVTCVQLPEGISSNGVPVSLPARPRPLYVAGSGRVRRQLPSASATWVSRPRRATFCTPCTPSTTFCTVLGHLHDRGAGIARAEEIYQAAEQAAPVIGVGEAALAQRERFPGQGRFTRQTSVRTLRHGNFATCCIVGESFSTVSFHGGPTTPFW